MKRLPIHDLIEPQPRPEFTPSLIRAFHQKHRQMVETYWFTDAICSYFNEIFDSVARGSGQGFWVQAEYGAGKTHFLVTLAALLTHVEDKDLWKSVQDEEIRNSRSRLATSKLFPVVISLLGEGSSDPYLGRSLLDVLLEGFEDALQEEGLDGKVQLTAAQDLINWLETQASKGVQAEAAEFIQKKAGKSIQDYRDEYGVTELAKILSEYFTKANIVPANIAVGIKDRLAYIFRQLTESAGYNGLLVVIDEYEGWEKGHGTPEEKSRDAELLETLGFILPRDLSLSVYTIVASTSSVPTKLQGSGEGDRFIPIPLLAQSNEHDYDVIISRRTRELVESKLPEIEDHFHYYSDQFDFARGLSPEEFREVFPFQPRCFEAIRRITARDLPTARSGLTVFWEVINDTELTNQTELIRLADMIRSPHLVEECLTKTVYKESYFAYKAADNAIPELGLDEDEVLLARDLLATIYLWYAAHLDQTKPLTLHELAEATLTTESKDGIKPQDVVALVLEKMRQLRQVDFDNSAAVFKVTGEGLGPLTAFNEHKRRILRDPYALQNAITDSLFFTVRQTGSVTGLFGEFQLDTAVSKRLTSRNLEYSGDAIIANSWRLDHGMALPKEDIHFRVVILTPSAVPNLKPQDLVDARIAVVIPGELTDEIREAAAAYKAWLVMGEEFRNQNGKQVDEVKSWLDTQKQRIYGELVATHLKLYQSGQIITKDNLGISARDAFGHGGSNDTRLGLIIERLLTNAYPNLPIETSSFRAPLSTADLGKIFDGYFAKNPKPADTNATRNFGVYLGFSHPDKSQHFSPQDVRVFHLLDEMLSDKAELWVWEIFDKLAQPPYGLPYGLAQLYLLAYVRHHSPRLDLMLKPRHNLQTRGGQPITRDRLTSATVADLAWKPRLDDKFDALVPGVGPSWTDTLPYARIIDDNLRATTDQAEVEHQSDRLLKSLEGLKSEIGTVQNTLDNLAGTLGKRLPANANGVLENLSQLAGGEFDGFGDFHEAAESIFQGSPEALRDAMQTFTRLRTLGSIAAEIISAKNYLDQAPSPETDRELVKFRSNLLGQFELDGLLAGPESWGKLKAEFNQFRGRYRNAYQKHHRDYYAAIERLRGMLADVPKQLQALALLNQIQMGRPAGEDLSDRYDHLIRDLETCSVADVTAVNVDYAPICDACKLQITKRAPEDDAQRLLDDMHDALDLKTRQIAEDSVAKILREGKRPELATILDAAQAMDLVTIVASLNQDAAKLINKELQKQGIVIFEANLLEELKQQYPALEEADIPRLLGDFEKLLKKAFSKARKENIGKKTFRLTWK